MRPFEKKVLGEAELISITHATWPVMFSQMGVNNSSCSTSAEIKAYVDLLKREDDGKGEERENGVPVYTGARF